MKRSRLCAVARRYPAVLDPSRPSELEPMNGRSPLGSGPTDLRMPEPLPVSYDELRLLPLHWYPNFERARTGNRIEVLTIFLELRRVRGMKP